MDSIKIKIPPEKVFDWLMNLDKHYKEWHPDHLSYTKETSGNGVGDSIRFEENLHGEPHTLRAKFTKIEKDRLIEYKCLFPMSIICPKGSFVLEAGDDATVFTATLTFRFGWLLDRFMKKRTEAMKMHMKEEGENLKKLLEAEI